MPAKWWLWGKSDHRAVCVQKCSQFICASFQYLRFYGSQRLYRSKIFSWYNNNTLQQIVDHKHMKKLHVPPALITNIFLNKKSSCIIWWRTNFTWNFEPQIIQLASYAPCKMLAIFPKWFLIFLQSSHPLFIKDLNGCVNQK